MPKLSETAVTIFRRKQTEAVLAALDGQRSAEPWSLGDHPELQAIFAALGSKLDLASGRSALFEQPQLDALRVGLTYIGPDRRFMVLRHLAPHQLADGTPALDALFGARPATTEPASTGCALMVAALRDLETRQLLAQIFSDENIGFVLAALGLNDAQSSDAISLAGK